MAKIKYLESGTFKEMEVKPIVKHILDEYYKDYPYECHSKEVLEDEMGLIETALKVVKQKVEKVLKEIKKEMKLAWKITKETKQDMLNFSYGYYKGLMRAKSLVKKAFKEVLENGDNN